MPSTFVLISVALLLYKITKFYIIPNPKFIIFQELQPVLTHVPFLMMVLTVVQQQLSRARQFQTVKPVFVVPIYVTRQSNQKSAGFS